MADEKNHSTGEILIADMCEIERRERGSDPHGGVFIAVKKDLIATREHELETGCGVILCKLLKMNLFRPLTNLVVMLMNFVVKYR